MEQCGIGGRGGGFDLRRRSCVRFRFWDGGELAEQGEWVQGVAGDAGPVPFRFGLQIRFGLGQVVFVRDAAIVDRISGGLAIALAELLEFGFGVAAKTFGVMPRAEFFGAVIAVPLEGF